MTESGNKCDYCGQSITDESMAAIEVYDKDQHEYIWFCDSFCKLASCKRIVPKDKDD